MFYVESTYIIVSLIQIFAAPVIKSAAY